MKITKKLRITASRTLESIQWGKTVVVPEATIQAIANDIQDHLDTLYPELNLECFVEIMKDYRGYQSIHVSTYPHQVYDPVLKYYVFLHDTTVAYYGDTKVYEDSLDVRADYADIVCDIITKHVSTLPGRVTGSEEVSDSTPVDSAAIDRCIRALSRLPKGHRNVAILVVKGINPRRPVIYIQANSKFAANGRDPYLTSTEVFDLLQAFCKVAEPVMEKYVHIDYCQLVKNLDGFDFSMMYDVSAKTSANLPVTSSSYVSDTITLQADYFYDTVKNMEDNGWDDILDWFRSNAWIHNGALIVPAGIELHWVSEDRYYTTYQVYTPAGTQKIPFLKPEMGGEPLTTSQPSTLVTSSEDVEDFDEIVDDPNCREHAIQLIKDAAKAHNYIGDIDAEIAEVGSSPESLYHIYHDIIDVGAEVQSDGLGNWRFLLPSETEYDEPVIHTDKGYYVVCARGSIRLVPIDEDELFYE